MNQLYNIPWLGHNPLLPLHNPPQPHKTQDYELISRDLFIICRKIVRMLNHIQDNLYLLTGNRLWQNRNANNFLHL